MCRPLPVLLISVRVEYSIWQFLLKTDVVSSSHSAVINFLVGVQIERHEIHSKTVDARVWANGKTSYWYWMEKISRLVESHLCIFRCKPHLAIIIDGICWNLKHRFNMIACSVEKICNRQSSVRSTRLTPQPSLRNHKNITRPNISRYCWHYKYRLTMACLFRTVYLRTGSTAIKQYDHRPHLSYINKSLL